ncbi:hypothetical protein SJAG_02073 [Schizosaccharomyces japonicus yFS275]|uniref:Small acidic protein-like domain-containing protein n=1 Tax=Schizosaccharomyces japonicus (strain yFS275 / FY16936) TaxID=402676 RepID=B6JZN1_SCHJY|nr:hypothetical protein SJAG_02073 [Schizosaccharomyces japonicus yFS275]EEB06999.1 hypothetical protein SJAG_02073 [Schizosaccharomyces japonicus yFS275]
MGSSKKAKLTSKDEKKPIWGTSVETFRKLSSKEKKKLSKDELKAYKKLKHRVKKFKLEQKAMKDKSSSHAKSSSHEKHAKHSKTKEVEPEKEVSAVSASGNKEYWLSSALQGGNSRKAKFLKMMGIKNVDTTTVVEKNDKNVVVREKQLEQQFMSSVVHKGTRKGLGA